MDDKRPTDRPISNDRVHTVRGAFTRRHTVSEMTVGGSAGSMRWPGSNQPKLSGRTLSILKTRARQLKSQ